MAKTNTTTTPVPETGAITCPECGQVCRAGKHAEQHAYGHWLRGDRTVNDLKGEALRRYRVLVPEA